MIITSAADALALFSKRPPVWATTTVANSRSTNSFQQSSDSFQPLNLSLNRRPSNLPQPLPLHRLQSGIRNGYGFRPLTTSSSILASNNNGGFNGFRMPNQQQQMGGDEERGATLAKYSTDLTDLASKGLLDPVIGRDSEIRRVIQILSRRTKSCPVVVGEAGIGKTAIIEGLARRISSGEVPQSMKDKKIKSLDLGALLAGAVHRGSFEERFKNLLKDLEEEQGETILFIDEVHMLLGLGKAEGALDAANM